MSTNEQDQARQMIQSERDLPVQAIRFTPINDYTTFNAEYAAVGRDIVVHFFLPVEALVARTGQAPTDDAQRDHWAQYFLENHAELRRYWLDVFPRALQQSAEAAFHARPPRLASDFTPEVSSWFFRATGFHVLKPEVFVRTMLAQLDQRLDGEGAAEMLAWKLT